MAGAPDLDPPANQDQQLMAPATPPMKPPGIADRFTDLLAPLTQDQRQGMIASRPWATSRGGARAVARSPTWWRSNSEFSPSMIASSASAPGSSASPWSRSSRRWQPGVASIPRDDPLAAAMAASRLDVVAASHLARLEVDLAELVLAQIRQGDRLRRAR